MSLKQTFDDHYLMLREIMSVGTVSTVLSDTQCGAEIKIFTVSDILPDYQGVYVMDEDQTIEEISSQVLHSIAQLLEDY